MQASVGCAGGNFGDVEFFEGDVGWGLWGACAMCKAANEGLDDGAAWPLIRVTTRGLEGAEARAYRERCALSDHGNGGI
jgi:hypothetical protein